MKFPALLTAFAALTIHAAAQKMQTPAGEAPGPWILGTVGVGKGADAKTPKTTALKGLAIKVGEKGDAAVAYDLDLCRMVGAWTGKFTTSMNLMSRGEYPTALGEVAFTTGEGPGFLVGDAAQPWKDPRSEPFGPLPPGQARFKGFYANGDKTILKWNIGGTEVLEMPAARVLGRDAHFYRSFKIGPSDHPVRVALCTRVPNDELNETAGSIGLAFDTAAGALILTAYGETDACIWKAGDSHYFYEVPADTQPRIVTVGVAWISRETFEAREPGVGIVADPSEIDPSRDAIPGPIRYGEPVVTSGELSAKTNEGYVVDTIKLPDPNPWGAPIFTSGFDFFEDGRAVVCTFHGDVFVVSGIDEKLEKVTWRRFASGLYHPLGLKIVKGEIFVTCRDGIWRLQDLNKDGECDFYEAFNFDLKVTKSFHEFVFDLQTDAAGNFYFAKAGPVKNGGRGFDEIMNQHGTLMRVSPDGARLDVIATGFRAPNGIGVGPLGELTSGDNEGTWTPACKINWIRTGGFYGVVDLAHRTPPPTDYDRPLCWLPKRVDNSGGSQVWAPEGERWGPWGGKMLHLSYGQSALYGVLMEKCGIADSPATAAAAAQSAIPNPQSAIVQGGVTKFPLQFQSGIMRARFNPRDGQLYVMGLRGWQTNGLKNGCFQRVRFTGAVLRMPIEMHVKKSGIELRFACSLDTQSAADPQNWNIEQWRYTWSAAYGSPELSTEDADAAPGEIGRDGRAEFTSAQAAQKKHDPVTVKSVAIGTDDRTVFLEIPELKPVMQMAIKYDLKTADGHELRGEVVNTIHALGGE